jgi:hypothetical protein
MNKRKRKTPNENSISNSSQRSSGAPIGSQSNPGKSDQKRKNENANAPHFDTAAQRVASDPQVEASKSNLGEDYQTDSRP